MLKALALSIAALGAFSVAANAAPTKLSKAQMDQVVAGANRLPNGTNPNSNGRSGAPGNSFKAPGQTNNPNPGK